MNARAAAAKIIFQVISQKKSLDDALRNCLAPYKEQRDRSFIKELSYGTLRWYFKLDAIAKSLLTKDSKATDPLVYNLILIGLYQLLYLKTPEHAAIFETVEATAAIKKPKAKGFVNGVLRNFIRQKDKTMKKIDQNLSAKYSHPAWLIKLLQKSWTNWEEILTANNERAPLHLRVNLQKISRENYLKKLKAFEIKATAPKNPTTAITLKNPIDVSKLPGFYDGEVSVQDLSAQYVTELLELKPGLRVLDACAAPGGKTCHILETMPKVKELVAIDSIAARVEMIKDNLKRLELSATVICDDATKPDNWWNGKKFDRILIDAPCSGTGVIRRHPDIKALRKPQDIEANVKLQLQLLESLWPLLAKDGILVYATCSVLPTENFLVIKKFLEKHKNAQEKIITAEWGEKVEHGRQIFTSANGGDGFYYIKIIPACPRN
jgi:16S rRNA (cytosine967-C5)-methyltransferase